MVPNEPRIDKNKILDNNLELSYYIFTRFTLLCLALSFSINLDDSWIILV